MPSPLGAWDDLIDLSTEGLLAAFFLFGALAMWWLGPRMGMTGRPGWRPMAVGMTLLAMMAGLDFLDEFFDELWVVAGTDTEATIEDLLLPLAGVGSLVYGILRWVPMHGKLAEAEAELHEAEIHRLEERDAFQTAFLNTAAHELATPLTPIRLQVAILEQKEGNGENLDLLGRNLDRLERLVGDLLDASRLQAVGLQYDKVPIDLVDLIEEIETTFRSKAADEGIELTVQADAELRLEAADEDRISQILYNLVGNAIKFTSEGGRVEVRAWQDDDEVLIQVEDTGAGLDPEELKGVFRPFEQFHRDLVGAQTGSGLGLHISQGIARAHGGYIEATSDGRGAGSCFTLHLPVDPVGTQEPGEGAQPQAPMLHPRGRPETT